MEKSSTTKEMASPYSKCNHSNTANSSPKKRQKVSEDSENCASFDSDFSIKLSSPKFAVKKDKLNLKGKINLKASKSILNKPKKNITAYAFFIKQKKKDYYAANLENVNSTSMMKELGHQWATISDEDKMPFFELAENDRRRYEKEVQLFKDKLGNSNLMKEIESSRPKKALSAYMIFVRETRPKICQKYPQMHSLEVMKEVGKEWQILNSEEKKRFEQSAILDKQRYLQEIKKFEEKFGELENFKENIETKEEIKEEVFNNLLFEPTTSPKKNPKTIENKQKKTSKRCKTIKEEGKPKRPLSAYIYFSQDVRESIKRECERYSSTDIMKEVSSRWACLDQESKDAYSELAAQDKIRFDNEMKLYNLVQSNSNMNIDHKGEEKIIAKPDEKSIQKLDPKCNSDLHNDGTIFLINQNEESNSEESNEDEEYFCNSPKFVIEKVYPSKKKQNEDYEVIKLTHEIEDEIDKEESVNCGKESYNDEQMNDDNSQIKIQDNNYESYYEESQICSNQYYELDEELDDESDYILPFLNQPRMVYRSMLDYNLEYYLQSRYRACPDLSLQGIMPTL